MSIKNENRNKILKKHLSSQTFFYIALVSFLGSIFYFFFETLNCVLLLNHSIDESLGDSIGSNLVFEIIGEISGVWSNKYIYPQLVCLIIYLLASILIFYGLTSLHRYYSERKSSTKGYIIVPIALVFQFLAGISRYYFELHYGANGLSNAEGIIFAVIAILALIFLFAVIITFIKARKKSKINPIIIGYTGLFGASRIFTVAKSVLYFAIFLYMFSAILLVDLLMGVGGMSQISESDLWTYFGDATFYFSILFGRICSNICLFIADMLYIYLFVEINNDNGKKISLLYNS